MYAFYSLLIYIFYSLFRRDGGAAAAADPRDPAQSARCKTGGRRRAPDQSAAELWTELTGLVGPTSLEESPSLSLRGEAQGQQPPQLEEDQRAWQRLEQLILGQLEELRQQLELQELELGRLRLGVGATDSEKRVQRLTLENEALKQSLTLTQNLLRHWGPSPPARAPQEEAEALVALQGQLQEAQDTTEALRVQLQQETEQNCRRELRQVHGQLAGLRAHMASLRRGCGDLRGLVSTFTQSCQGSLSEARGQVSWALGALSASGAGTQLPQEQQGPPSGCPGRLLELKGNIRVLCRLRPGTPSSLVSSEPGPGGTVTTCYRGHQHRFRLDWVFPPDASQEEVFRELEPTVLSCLRGYSVCIFTYGQTGTGKTYSMEGPPEDPGIAPRALQSLFREMRTGGQHRVTLSMVEIYNEAVRTGNQAFPFLTRDLLAPGPPERLAVRQGPASQGGIQVAGLTYWDVPDLETLHQMLSLGRSNRATAATAMNQHSSRSHALVTLTLRAASPLRGSGTAGTLHLVDLAGSERAWKAGAVCSARGDPDSAQRLREARTINRSLLALGGVMAALRARRPHVPFRDSQLTRLLQPALGPGATAVLLLQISTRPEDLGETVCSLKFAERVGQVELGPAQRRRAPRSGTPSSLSTDTPLTGTPCTPTPSPGSPPSPGPDSGSSSALAPPEDLPS
ncbi:Kinesin-like protein KIFC2 [Pteropus alecto]|uniref:Kinesin-like protein n=1 Tax=Pteropus alecto TaxID=9402 RepID=L5KK79_PTEAL|nr:Kinesin-like protein KIFC2 [Pteropus alecto]